MIKKRRYSVQSTRRLKIAKTIQPEERSTGGVMEGVLYKRDSDDNLYVRYLYRNDGQWNRDYNWLDNKWDDHNPAVISASLFISSLEFFRRSFVLQLVHAIPRAYDQPHLAFLTNEGGRKWGQVLNLEFTKTKKISQEEKTLLVTPRGLRWNQFMEELRGWVQFQRLILGQT